MVSAKLIHQIEDHWEQISGRFIRLVRNTPEVAHLSRLPESELTDACRRILSHLGDWLVSGSESEISWHYERIGALRRRQGIPLSECIRALQFVKDATVNFIEDEGPAATSLGLYAEEEFENQLGRFFDLLVFHLARGYEGAPPVAVHRSNTR